MIPSASKRSMKLTDKSKAALEEWQEKTAVKRKNNWDEEATPKKAHLTPQAGSDKPSRRQPVSKALTPSSVNASVKNNGDEEDPPKQDESASPEPIDSEDELGML